LLRSISHWFSRRRQGVTLLELLVVLVILSLLATLAVGVYSKEVVRARYARTRAEISELEVAINRYFVDVGEYPPTGSLSNVPGAGIGSAYLQIVLRSSISGNLNVPASKRWLGPYIEWDYAFLGDVTGAGLFPESTYDIRDVHLIDPFRSPYYYVNSNDYVADGGTELLTNHPFRATETFYNPTTFQIISFGVNRNTLPVPNRGLDPDDVTNFEGSLF